MHMDIRGNTPVIFIDENDNEIQGYIPYDDAEEIMNAQAQKVSQALINLLSNRDRIKEYVSERQ